MSGPGALDFRVVLDEHQVGIISQKDENGKAGEE